MPSAILVFPAFTSLDRHINPIQCTSIETYYDLVSLEGVGVDYLGNPLRCNLRATKIDTWLIASLRRPILSHV